MLVISSIDIYHCVCATSSITTSIVTVFIIYYSKLKGHPDYLYHFIRWRICRQYTISPEFLFMQMSYDSKVNGMWLPFSFVAFIHIVVGRKTLPSIPQKTYPSGNVELQVARVTHGYCEYKSVMTDGIKCVYCGDSDTVSIMPRNDNLVMPADHFITCRRA